jgi:hypothetical protein
MLPLLSSPFSHFFPSLASFLEGLCHIVLISLHARVLVERFVNPLQAVDAYELVDSMI